MSNELESDYFADRARVERDLSRTAEDPNAAAAHAELAERYEVLAEVFKSEHAKLKVAYKLATEKPGPVDGSAAAADSE